MSPSIFGQWMLYLPGAIEGLAAVLIGLASLETAVRIAGLFIRRRVTGAAKEEIRLRLGVWLSLALELEIAADILRTTIAPSWDEIGKLAAVVALRTVLNYFLQMEISRAALSDSDVTQPPAGAGRRVAGKSTESRDVSERVRLETLCKRDGWKRLVSERAGLQPCIVGPCTTQPTMRRSLIRSRFLSGVSPSYRGLQIPALSRDP